MQTIDNLKERLIESNIRPTYQRLKILEYLDEYRTHPTVDEIYISLCDKIPTLSKTTVYNTLKAFGKANLVDEVKIENTEIRYDIVREPHGHLKCTECGKIFDFAIDMEKLDSEDLEGFEISEKNIYFSGLCPECQKK